MAKSSFSIVEYFNSWSFSVLEAKQIGLLSCDKTAPNATLDASVVSINFLLSINKGNFV